MAASMHVKPWRSRVATAISRIMSDFTVIADLVLANEVGLRLGGFLGVLGVMALWEVYAPRRRLSASRWQRWSSNLGIVAIDALMLRLLLPVAAVGAAFLAAEQGWGLFNAVSVPLWIAVLGAILVLDFAIYVQHVVFHKVPLLWRLHRVHHTDVDLDVTSGVRFHPLEIALSLVIKIAVIVALGAPAVAVVAFEVLLNATALFNHANVRLPRAADRILRAAIVTPDMHRVHHSVHRDETDSNYGFNLSLWDRLFRTYRDQPRDGHVGMTIGLNLFRSSRERWLPRLLIQPFVRE
jgi:sterol desaturase/sphingolipid hydroxylase (fatty acid hydroxylase superfamily)